MRCFFVLIAIAMAACGSAPALQNDGGSQADAGQIVRRDAGMPVCTIGEDSSCGTVTDAGTMTKGRCISGVAGNTCVCNSGSTLDPVTGRCI